MKALAEKNDRHSKPLRVLDEQVALIRWLKFNRFAPAMVEGFADALRIKSEGGNTLPMVRPLKEILGIARPDLPLHDEVNPLPAQPKIEGEADKPLSKDMFRSLLVTTLDTSESVFVSTRVMNILWPFVQDHEIDEVVMPNDLPISRAFVWLEKPIQINDVRGQKLVVQAVQWVSVVHGVMVVYYSNAHSMEDDINREMRAKVEDEWGLNWEEVSSRLPIVHVQSFPFGQRLTLDDDHYLVPKDLDLDAEWGFEEHLKTEKTIAAGIEDMNAMLRFFLALWSFMGEEIPYRRIAGPKMLRRLVKAKIGFSSEVKVVDLRRSEGNPVKPDWDPQLVMWTHRWKVRGHKRKIRDHKTGEIREIDVRPHVKGPEHLPLIEKDTVYNVRR